MLTTANYICVDNLFICLLFWDGDASSWINEFIRTNLQTSGLLPPCLRRSHHTCLSLFLLSPCVNMHLHACPPRPRLTLYANKNSQHLHPRCCFTLLLSSFLRRPAQSWVLLPGSSNHLFSVILLNDPNLKLRRLWKHIFSGKNPPSSLT